MMIIIMNMTMIFIIIMTIVTTITIIILTIVTTIIMIIVTIAMLVIFMIKRFSTIKKKQVPMIFSLGLLLQVLMTLITLNIDLLTVVERFDIIDITVWSLRHHYSSLYAEGFLPTLATIPDCPCSWYTGG